MCIYFLYSFSKNTIYKSTINFILKNTKGTFIICKLLTVYHLKYFCHFFKYFLYFKYSFIIVSTNILL